MKKQTLLKIVNPILGILFLNQLITGFLFEHMDYETFEMLHGWGGALLGVFALLHVILNWSWIKANFLKSKKRVLI